MTDTQTDRRQRSYNVSHATAMGQIIIQCRSRSRAPSVPADVWSSVSELRADFLMSVWRRFEGYCCVLQSDVDAWIAQLVADSERHEETCEKAEDDNMNGMNQVWIRPAVSSMYVLTHCVRSSLQSTHWFYTLHIQTEVCARQGYRA